MVSTAKAAESLPSARVLVVDDHATVRLALVRLIDSAAPSLQCVGAAGSCDEGLRLTRDVQPDWIVLDADLAGDDGISIIPALRKASPCRIVVISSQLDADLSAYAMRLGANACVHKHAPAEDLIKTMSNFFPAAALDVDASEN